MIKFFNKFKFTFDIEISSPKLYAGAEIDDMRYVRLWQILQESEVDIESYQIVVNSV